MTRDQRLIAVFTVLAVLAGGVAGGTIAVGDDPAVPVVSRGVATGPDGMVSIQFVGDTMAGSALQPLIDQRGYDWPFDGVRTGTLAADFVVAAADAPITEHAVPTGPAASSSFTARPPVAAALARAGVDALTLATDHAFDAGPEGLADTVLHAEAAGLATFGAGPDLARAEQPLLLRTPFGTVGVVGTGQSFGRRASDVEPGTLVLSPASVARSADLARAAGADWVVAAVHWGKSYATVQPQQRYWAQVFADAGYELVIGSGPHLPQPIELVGSVPVVYSAGNFVYGTNGRFARLGVPGFGLAVGLELGPDRPPRVTVRCLVTDNRATGFQPRYCDAAQTAALLPTLGADLEVQGDVAVLACDCPFRPEGS